MTSRSGIFFNSKSRANDKVNQLSAEISNKDSSNNINQATATATATATAVKKKIILNHTKRTLNKSIYSGPRKIFSTNYRVIYQV